MTVNNSDIKKTWNTIPEDCHIQLQQCFNDSNQIFHQKSSTPYSVCFAILSMLQKLKKI